MVIDFINKSLKNSLEGEISVTQEVTSYALNDLKNKKVESLTIKNVVTISQSDYDELAVKDASTLYIIQ